MNAGDRRLADNTDLGRKILVAGHGGKSTLARVLAADLDLPYVELDAINWLPDWVERSKDDFRELVQKALEENPDGWVVDGNYGTDLQGMIVRRAETVIYVNMSWGLMFWRTFWRAVARARDRRLICGENIESWRHTFLSRDSLLCFLIKNRKNFQRRRTERLRGWAEGEQMIELTGRAALNRFYEERGLFRGG